MNAIALRSWQTALRYRAAWPAVGIVAVATVAYWFTLSSLADYLRLDTPLAYLLLLPFFSLLVAVVTVLRHRAAPPPPREPHIDLLIGVPLLIVAVLMLAVLPAVWSTYYWIERPDVISLTLFVTGALVIAYGATWTWRLRGALLFLVLMWPTLYLHFMAGPMQALTDATGAALTAVAQHLPLGVVSSAGGILTVTTGAGRQVSMVLSTACSGANGMLGVVLVGSAMATVLDGPRRRKLLWIAMGMAMVFVLNVVRIISILVLARDGHPDLALGGYHAVIGLTLFTLTLLLMLLVAPRLGLRPGFLDAPAPRLSHPAASWFPNRPTLRYGVPLGLLLTAVLSLVAERDLGSYAAFIDGTGAPTARAFSLSDPLPNGWQASYFTTYDWAQQYFGSNSKFDRYVLRYGSGNSSQAWMDVVRTDDRGALDTYNIQSCFLFHDYDLRSTRRIDVGHGVVALLINYVDPKSHAQWVTVSWALPVLYSGQDDYERITITADLHRDGGTQAPDPQPSTGLRGIVLSLLNGFGTGSTSDTDSVFGSTDRALEGVATSVVDVTLRSALS